MFVDEFDDDAEMRDHWDESGFYLYKSPLLYVPAPSKDVNDTRFNLYDKQTKST